MRLALGGILIAILSAPACAQEPGVAKPNMVLQKSSRVCPGRTSRPYAS